ncbi:MAG: DUF4169 family protein [Alphaproteobacteria bacterium]|nr:DUF4169 family protein [Alphaproteobacteria bacterium]
MTNIVNLNRARKAKAKAESEKTAANNRIKHGTPKHLRKLSEAERKKAQAEIDAKRLEDDKAK